MNCAMRCCCMLAFAGLWNSAIAEPDHQPAVNVVREGSATEAEASVVLPGPPCAAYSMLTDYEHLPDFVPGLLESHAVRVRSNEVRVRQVGILPVLLLHIRMESLLDMHETPDRRIAFTQLKGNLVSYAGEWNFTETEDGTRVDYQALMTFKSHVPLFLARSALKRDLTEKFTGIANEADARAKSGRMECG